jgi:hypothetical protein
LKRNGNGSCSRSSAWPPSEKLRRKLNALPRNAPKKKPWQDRKPKPHDELRTLYDYSEPDKMRNLVSRRRTVSIGRRFDLEEGLTWQN